MSGKKVRAEGEEKRFPEQGQGKHRAVVKKFRLPAQNAPAKKGRPHVERERNSYNKTRREQEAGRGNRAAAGKTTGGTQGSAIASENRSEGSGRPQNREKTWRKVRGSAGCRYDRKSTLQGKKH